MERKRSLAKLRNILRSQVVGNLLMDRCEADEQRLCGDCAISCTALRKKLRSFL